MNESRGDLDGDFAGDDFFGVDFLGEAFLALLAKGLMTLGPTAALTGVTFVTAFSLLTPGAGCDFLDTALGLPMREVLGTGIFVDIRAALVGTDFETTTLLGVGLAGATLLGVALTGDFLAGVGFA